MSTKTMIVKVTTPEDRTPERSLRQLARAAERRDLSTEALRTLVMLASMAHGTGQVGDILCASIPEADLDALEHYGYVRRGPADGVELL